MEIYLNPDRAELGGNRRADESFASNPYPATPSAAGSQPSGTQTLLHGGALHMMTAVAWPSGAGGALCFYTRFSSGSSGTRGTWKPHAALAFGSGTLFGLGVLPTGSSGSSSPVEAAEEFGTGASHNSRSGWFKTVGFVANTMARLFHRDDAVRACNG